MPIKIVKERYNNPQPKAPSRRVKQKQFSLYQTDDGACRGCTSSPAAKLMIYYSINRARTTRRRKGAVDSDSYLSPLDFY